MTKETLQTLVDQLPEEFELTTFIESLKSIERREKRQFMPAEGSVKNHEEVLDYWEKKFKEKGN